MTYSYSRSPVDGDETFDIRDPDGVRISFVQFRDDAARAQEKAAFLVGVLNATLEDVAAE